MRIGLHAYKTDPLLPQRDGVNFAHENITQLLSEVDNTDLNVEFHDFTEILSDLDHAYDVLRKLDCVFSNVGPHAHYYFWLREKLGLNFRIVRDVRTAIWSSYLLQEHLSSPLLRASDTLMAASNYVWALYLRMFPKLSYYPASVCYPLCASFPQPRPARHMPLSRQKDLINLGYLGRLSEDKNFPDIIELLVRLNTATSGNPRYRLIACGEVHSDSCTAEQVNRQVTAQLGDGDWYDYRPQVRVEEIWQLLAEFDVMIFPSTSNLETFGRVLVEASYAHLPVVAGLHAAAAELVDGRGLCRVDYKTDYSFAAHFDHQMGRIDIDEMARLIVSGGLQGSTCYDEYAKHPAEFIELLQVVPPVGHPVLQADQRKFVDALEVSLPPQPTASQALIDLEQMAKWFVELQDKRGKNYQRRLQTLREISRHPGRTERYIAKWGPPKTPSPMAA